MAKAVQRRRGTTLEHSFFAGLVGEITVDTTKNTLVVHDGTTLGGYPLARESDLKNVTSEININIANKVDRNEFTTSINNITNSLNAKVEKTEYDRTVQSIQTSVNDKVSIVTFQNNNNAINAELTSLENDIKTINSTLNGMQGKVTYLTSYNFGDPSTTPNWQSVLSTYAKNQLGTSTIENSTSVQNIWNGHEWIYNSTTGLWVDYGIAFVAKATNLELGIVKGSTVAGAVRINTDGSMTIPDAAVSSASANGTKGLVTYAADSNRTARNLAVTPAGAVVIANERAAAKITFGTTELTPGISSLANGVFYFVYE